jgi:hypothetical protein
MSDAEESPRLTVLRRQDKLNRLAKERLRVVGGKVEKYNAAPPARDIEAMAAAEAAERLANPDIGDLVPGKGIFFGTYAVTAGKGGLKKVFNMYAAPEDLADEAGVKILSYSGALSRVAGLKNWHGHDGTRYTTDVAIFKALEEGSYEGGWFIPPRAMLMGQDHAERNTQADNLYAHQNKGSFKEAFNVARSVGTDRRNYYWSSTQYLNYPLAVLMWGMPFSDALGGFYDHERYRLSCRPVRLEPKL